MMKRRSFVKASLLTAAAAQIAFKPDQIREFYELRAYLLKDERQQIAIENYLKETAIPALNKLGSKNVGVFTELNSTGQTKLYVLIPFNSIEHFLKVRTEMPAEASSAVEPAYDRIESSLLQAFNNAPKLQVPPDKPTLYELRRYEHASEAAGKKKLEMFNDGGEVDIFKRLGFNPVFFGETLIGENRPNLIYMISFTDMDAHDAHWKAFGSDPQWKKLSAIPDYADSKLVSHITSTFLRPAAISQI